MITTDTPVTATFLGFGIQQPSPYGGSGVITVAGNFAAGVLQSVNAFGSAVFTAFTAMVSPAYGAGVITTAGKFASAALREVSPFVLSPVATPVRLEVRRYYDGSPLASVDSLTVKPNYSFWIHS